MKIEAMNGYPEECLRLIREAEEVEFTDTVKAKMNFLIAAKILMDLYLSDSLNNIEFKEEAQNLYDRYLSLNKKYGRVVAKRGYRVVTKSANRQFVTTLEPPNNSIPLEKTLLKQDSSQPAEEFRKKSKISLDSVCGLEEMKETIMLKIVAPFKNPEVCEFYGRKGKSGILMYGPPGCGKSLIAEAIANEMGASFFNVKASDLKSKWVGETEKKMAELFAKARSKQPAIIFLDEFESLGRERSNVNNSFEKDFISQMLIEIDGMGNKESKIVLIAATNQPWEIDSALLRSGRLGTRLFISPPNKAARREILEKELENKPIESNFDIDVLVEKTFGFSGSDMVELCTLASENAMKDYFTNGQMRNINLEDFLVALKKIKPVTSTWLKNAIRQIRLKEMDEEYPELLESENREDI